ncbi:hypothetical protein [Mesobacillus jeotgali]|uniref:hypothetical protein n=1 Tax=Mesobacillus jeotgali TaxID=129985 RepID=UPI001CFE4EAE|nr:hypothetical protein [Mesobacillus jeotgali]
MRNEARFYSRGFFLINLIKFAATGDKSAATGDKSAATGDKSCVTGDKSAATGNKSEATVNKLAANVNKKSATVNKLHDHRDTGKFTGNNPKFRHPTGLISPFMVIGRGNRPFFIIYPTSACQN